MRTSNPPAPAARRARRRVRTGTLVLLLGLVLLAPSGAPAHATTARHGSCPATTKHARHAARGTRCVKRAIHHAKPSHPPTKHGHPPGKGSQRGSSAPTRTAALCEDGSAPVRRQGGYSCADGSEPGCEAGGELLAASGAAPLCQASAASAGEAPGCSSEGASECQASEVSCEESSGAAPGACELSLSSESDS